MAVYQGIMLAILVTIVAFSSVQGQEFITPTERALRANLTKLVQYVVHPSAEPSMDLINYALVAGGQPKNQAERMAYLGLMKKIARGIPELVKQFTTTTTLPGGIKSETLDESGLDARITMRAMQYVQKQKEEAAAAKSATGIGAVSTASGSNATVSTGVSSAATGLTPNTGAISTVSGSHETPIVPASVGNIQNDVNQYQSGAASQLDAAGPVTVQDLQHNTIIPAADGTISLEDVFKFINANNVQNQANPQFMI
ncbi:uncharacterized protein LOC123555335 [Mercenaria mercenaria]|uniref:uncharacterized protein LOC123555335 n=1 Tax=Mercenaria mercenaria TaxID=6596 RepID=UPI00234EA327|nr:uncharacterized protein LOC123555335 [Mercenaria mercenaria]